jgi:hypothetical protein
LGCADPADLPVSTPEFVLNPYSVEGTTEQEWLQSIAELEFEREEPDERDETA